MVLGHDVFYPRFGWVRIRRHGLRSEYDVNAPFLVMELVPNTLAARRGLMRSGAEFEGL